MLISVDLPAPLLPMTACTSPICSSIDTLPTAVSPPKRRVSRLDRSSGSAMRAPGGAAGGQARLQPDQALRQQRDERDDGQAERELPARGESAQQRFGLEQLLQQRERDGADHRAAQ